MRTLMIGIVGVVVALSAIAAQEPTCRNCPGTYIPNSEVQAYAKRAIQYGLVDQQIRAVDIGKTNLDVGVVYRGRLAKPAEASVAEHDQVSEVYHIIDGSATLVTGPDLRYRVRDHMPCCHLDIRISCGAHLLSRRRQRD